MTEAYKFSLSQVESTIVGERYPEAWGHSAQLNQEPSDRLPEPEGFSQFEFVWPPEQFVERR
jgi:hypothetical protein